MAFVKQYTFGVGQKVKAPPLNSNFDDIAAFLNNNVALSDGSKAFTGLPSVALDPVNANDLSRKSYVDSKVSTLSTTVSTLSTTVSAADVQRLKVLNIGTSAVGSTPTVATTQFQIEAGIASFTAADGIFTVTFPTAFTSGVVSIVATVTGSSTYEAGTPNAWVRIGAQSKTAFSGIVLQPGAVFGVTGAIPFTSACKVNWIAVGW
jgi:hypothetical protein